MDAYIFVRGVDASTVDGIRGLHGEMPEVVRFVGTLSGAYDLFVAVEVGDLTELEEVVIGRIHAAGALDTDTSIVVKAPTATAAVAMPKIPRRWIVAQLVEAYVRIQTEAGRAEEVLQAVVDLDGFLGAAIVAGEYDILLGMGGRSYQLVVDKLLGQLQNVGGIERTVSSFATNASEEAAE